MLPGSVRLKPLQLTNELLRVFRHGALWCVHELQADLWLIFIVL